MSKSNVRVTNLPSALRTLGASGKIVDGSGGAEGFAAGDLPENAVQVLVQAKSACDITTTGVDPSGNSAFALAEGQMVLMTRDQAAALKVNGGIVYAEMLTH